MSRASVLLSALSLAVSLCLAAEPGPPAVAVVAADRVNVRLRPDIDAPVLGQLGRGTGVVVRGVAGGWCEIDYPASLAVWIGSKLLRTDSDPLSLEQGGSAAGVVLRQGARLRAAPSLSGAVLSERALGEDLTVVGTFGEWLRVLPPADLRAYAHSDYVELARDRVPGPASPSAPREGLPDAVLERLTRARGILASAEVALDRTREALEDLNQALAFEGLDEDGRLRVRLAVRDLLGALPPSRWLELFDEAEARRRRELESVERRYSAAVREARRSLDGTRPLDYTARGTLRERVQGSNLYRLMHNGALLYELDPGGADLSIFEGKRVGVIGTPRPAPRPGGAPSIEVTYVEEIETRDDGGL